MTLISASVRSAFTPTGVLRASINLGNPILAHRDEATGELFGVSIDLAREFAKRLGVDVELVAVDKAVKSVEVVKSDQADIGFFAIDPARSEGLQFTPPYVLIEGSYLVLESSALQDNAAVDAAGMHVAVGSGSAYDLFLTRELKHASIDRLVNAPAVLAALQSGQAQVAAGIRKLLEDWSRQHAGLRLLPGRFMVIQQAMGTPAGRGAEAAAVLNAFVEDTKASGFVADSLKRHKIEGGTVAPPAHAH
jgi:polar amino acid transport system substrate-binding protein